MSSSSELQIVKTQKISIEFLAGLFSLLPDTPWIPGCVASNSRGELRSVGVVKLPPEAIESQSSIRLHLTAESDCTLELFQLDCTVEPSRASTWNSISLDRSWPSQGGIDEGTTRFLGSVKIKRGEVSELTTDKLSSRLPHIGLLLRRGDMGPQTVSITAELHIERNNRWTC